MYTREVSEPAVAGVVVLKWVNLACAFSFTPEIHVMYFSFFFHSLFLLTKPFYQIKAEIMRGLMPYISPGLTDEIDNLSTARRFWLSSGTRNKIIV